jgi:acyl-CoA synthetase (AMP-forming)/AMP-acid ligase II
MCCHAASRHPGRPDAVPKYYRIAKAMHVDSDITARLIALAAAAPGAPAILEPAMETLSFGALADHARRTGIELAGWGIGRGDIVAWGNASRAQTAVALAALPASATIATLNASAPFDAVCGVLARLRPKAVVVPHDGDSAVARAARHLDLTQIVAEQRIGAGAGAFDLVLSRATTSLRDGARVREDWACLGATSGATGRPKIVSHGHRQIVRTALATGERLAIGSDDISGHMMPLHLAGGIRNAYFQTLLNGGAVNVLPVGDTEAFIAACAAGTVTWMSASFTMFRELLARIESGRRFERGRLRCVRIASGRLEPAEMDRLEERLGVPVLTGLASSETGTTAQQRLPPAPRRRGSVGPLVDCEVRLVDADGKVVPRGEIGEIQVRGPQVFDGYFAEPELDAASFVDGWFRMGDLGRFDDAGELCLAGRVKEVINRGGDKISPLEIDAVLRSLAGVADAAAFAIPHPRLGEEVVAAVVIRPEVRLDAQTVLAHARRVLGANRAPRRIWFVDHLPRTDGGKIRRGELPALVGHRGPMEERRAVTPPTPAGSPMEMALAALWAEVLQVRPIHRDADFFQLGGNARLGADLLDKVRAVFGVQLTLEALRREAATVAGMARLVGR